MRRFPTGILLGFVALAAGACGGSREAPRPDLDSYFAADFYSERPKCREVDGKLSGERQMRLFQGAPGPLKELTQGLQRYFLRHDLRFFTTELPVQITQPYVLDNRGAAMKKALASQFPGLDLSDEQALRNDGALWPEIERFVMNFQARPLIEFAIRHSQAGQGVTNLVLVPELMAAPTGTTNKLLALAVSPALLTSFARSNRPEMAFWRDIAFPADFSPMLFLHAANMRDLRAIDEQVRDMTVAHEFGHTAGLVHKDTLGDFENLMYPRALPGSSPCDDQLTEQQLAEMRRTLALDDPAGTPTTRAALTAQHPAAEPSRPAPAHRLAPGDLQALFADDSGPLQRLLAPLVHFVP